MKRTKIKDREGYSLFFCCPVPDKVPNEFFSGNSVIVVDNAAKPVDHLSCFFVGGAKGWRRQRDGTCFHSWATFLSNDWCFPGTDEDSLDLLACLHASSWASSMCRIVGYVVDDLFQDLVVFHVLRIVEYHRQTVQNCRKLFRIYSGHVPVLH